MEHNSRKILCSNAPGQAICKGNLPKLVFPPFLQGSNVFSLICLTSGLIWVYSKEAKILFIFLSFRLSSASLPQHQTSFYIALWAHNCVIHFRLTRHSIPAAFPWLWARNGDLTAALQKTLSLFFPRAVHIRIHKFCVSSIWGFPLQFLIRIKSMPLIRISQVR